MIKVHVSTQSFDDVEPMTPIPLTRVTKPSTTWVGPRYVPNSKPTQQQMPAVNRRTLMGIPAQGGIKSAS